MSSILPKNELENVNFCPSLLRQKFFVRFLGELKTLKFPFEINWPLVRWTLKSWIKLIFDPQLVEVLVIGILGFDLNQNLPSDQANKEKLNFLDTYCIYKHQLILHGFLVHQSPQTTASYFSQIFNILAVWVNFAVMDGFRNICFFLFRNPLVTISVGLTINGKLVIGIINAPCIGKLYAAVKGRGATCNGKPMKVWNNGAN